MIGRYPPRLSRTFLRRAREDSSGAAAIEIAFALPILLMLLMGIISYGDWFLTAHTVQQATNDAARAAIAGLTTAERAQLANDTFKTMLARSGTLQPDLGSTATTDTGSGTDPNYTLTVQARYDASADPLLHLSFVAAPNPVIQRSAAITLGGL